MGSYRDIEGQLRGKRNAKILILDTNNIQFFYQHREVLPQSVIFEPYDIVLIPGWVHAEFSHHEGKSTYIAGISPAFLFFIEEAEDYFDHQEKCGGGFHTYIIVPFTLSLSE